MTKFKNIYLFLIASVLLVAGWPPLPTAFLLFIGFVPVLMIHENLIASKFKILKFFGWTYLVMFMFNLGSTWWVWNASISGCILMLVLNSLIMALPFLLFSFTKSILPRTGYFSLPIYYLAMEYIHFNWSASWPWMTLGKGLAAFPWFIQWYEYTGEMGGTAIIIVLNIWLFNIIKNNQLNRLWKPTLLVASIYGISIITSLIADLNTKVWKGKNTFECVVSQPNIDPYEEKFGDGVNAISGEQQLAYALDIAKPFITPQTILLVLPETAIVGWNSEKTINDLLIMKPALAMTDSNSLRILAGAETYNYFEVNNKPTITARYDSFSDIWFDCYNTALLIRKNRVDSLYHKSKLVPGVEKMPFEFLEKLSINLGGASGSLAASDKPVNFIINDQFKIAPLICYESVFGDYAAEFVRDGANVLAVITNDGWWGNSPGYQQHLLFGAIRSIETRKEMLRSANTGVSCKIDIFGHILQKTRYNERTAFRCFVTPNNYQTFYVKYGNLIGKISTFVAGMLIFSLLFFPFFNGKKNI